MAKYFIDLDGKVTTQKKEEEKKKKAKYSIDLDGNVTVNNTGDNDLAPVRADISTNQNATNSDYLALAQRGLAAYNQKKTEAIEKENSKSGFWKFLENMALAGLTANDNPAVMTMNQQAQIYRQDTSYKEPNDKWSQEQKNQFGYLYTMSPDYAAQYAEAINNQINKAAADAQKAQIMQDAGDSKLKSTATAILKGFTGTADFLDNIAEFSGRGTITQKAGLTFFEQSQAEIEGVSKKLNELGTINEDVAIVGGKGLGDLYGLGISAAQSLIYGATGNGALTIVQYFGQAAASGVDEKMSQGATAQQAMLFGIASGTAEAVAEKIGIDNLFKNSGAKTFQNFLGNMLKQGVAEGSEEAITSVLNTFSDQVIMGKESQYNRAVAEYSKTMSLEEAKKKALSDIMEGIAFDAIGGMITGSGNTAVMTGTRAVQNVSNSKGALSGLTKNEQKVVDKVYTDLVAEEAKNSKDGKVSQAKKNELYDQAVAAMDKGYIATDTIEEALGGEDFKAYQTAQEKENTVLKELEGLYQGEELAAQQQGIRDNSTLSQLRQTMGDKVAELVKGDRLAESYREKGRRSQLFQADVSQYDEKQRTIVQKAIDSGVLNNTNRSHELVDLIAKVGADKALDFDFTNNEKLKESGFALNGKTVNGYLSDSGVTVNINSARALNSVVGHEITHVLEGTGEFYTALESMVTEYAKSKGEYNARLTELRSLYADVDGYKGADGHEKIKRELVADLVGDYIFTDSEFINRLSVENRNVLEKIYDELKYLCRVATAGSKEARQLEKAKKAVEDAYRQDAKNTAKDGGVRYSMAGTHSDVANTQKLSDAKEMLEKGVDSETIRKETGWFQGYDNKWRYEINDSEMEVLKNLTSPLHARYVDGEMLRLDEVVKHDSLFEAYPQLRSMSVEVKRTLGKNVAGYYDSNVDVIRVSGSMYLTDDMLKQMLIHEIQHKIQSIEGFARGSSPSYWETKGIGETEYAKFVAQSEAERARIIAKLTDENRLDYLRYRETDKQIRMYTEALLNGRESEHQYTDLNMDAIEIENDALYRKMHHEAWFERLNEIDSILEDGVSEKLYTVFYKNTAGEIEARDVAGRISYTDEQRKSDRPDIDRANVTFAKRGESLAYIGDTKDGRRCYKSGFDSSVSMDERVDAFKNRIATIFNLGAVELKTDVKKIRIKGDKFTLQENIYGDKKGQPGEKKAKINSLYDLADILATAKYDSNATHKEPSYENPNIPPKNAAHKDVKYWYKFRNEIVFDGVPYSVTFNIRDKGNEQYQYLIDFKENKTPGLSNTVVNNLLRADQVSYKDIIRDTDADVNRQMSVSSQEDMFPVRKDLDAVRGKIYGSDVELRELGPVRQDLQTEEAAQDPYDDLPFDMPENLAEGQLTDEELEADAKRQPVETVAQRLEVKFASLRQELQTNEQNRKASAEAYDQRIAELQQRYDAKPKKHTKAANAILRQIAKQEQLKQQRDAEFEKRINDIKKKIDKTREQMQMDHTREDLLEKQLRQVDEKLEADKQALEVEFRERRAEVEKLAGKNTYISSEARNLYDEIINHKKGTRFSKEISYMLDKGHSFAQIKTALLLIEGKPEGAKNRSWVVEQDLREILGRNYENAAYEAEKIDEEYQERLTELEKQAKEDRESYTVAAQRKHKQQQYEQQMEELLGDTSTWKDKNLGIQYQVNTLRRNLRDVVRDEKGNRDIAKADAIWDELQGKYNHNEAELKRESARIKQAYADMKITKAEAVYIQMLGEFRHNPDTELSLETVEGFYKEHKDKIDTEKVDKAIELARQTYDELLQRVNTVLREQGMREIPYRKGYFPHFTEEAKGRFRMFLEKALNFKYRGDDIPTDIAGLTEGFAPNRSWQSFNKQRTSDLTAYSFTKGMDSYVHGALDWIYHIEDIQKRRALENHIRYIHSDEGIQERINEAKSNDMWDADQVQEEIDKILKEAKNPLNNLVTDLRTGTNILAGKKNSMDRGMENATNRAVYSVMTSLSSRINANMVAGSISSALTNFIPITQSWAEVSPKSSLRAMAETIMSYVTDDGTVNKSDFLTNRLRPEENLNKTGWDKVSDKVGWLMEAVDDFTSQTIWRSKYQENLSRGMSEAEAIKNADEFAEGVMAGRSRGNMPTLFDAKNPVARVLTAFQLEVNNQYGYMLKDLPINLQKEAKTNLVAAYGKMFIGAYVYNALYSQLTGRDAAFDPLRIIQELFNDMFPDEDEEEKKPSEVVGNLINNVAEELPFVGGLLGGGRIPISSALPYGEGPIEMITGTMQDIEGGDLANLTWEWLNPAFYLIAPVGGGQFRKTISGLGMFDDLPVVNWFTGDKPVSGSYTSSGNLRFPVAETPLNIAQAAVFGQWANENARKYIDEGRTPIAESQIQDYLDSGLTYEAWWKRKDELKKVDNDFEANEPITSFRQILEQVENVAAEADAGKEDLLKEKFLRSAADELSDIKAEMKELVTLPIAQTYRERNMQTLQEKANEIAQSAMDAYSKVEFDGDYARVGEKVWKHDEDGQWRRLTGDALTKYEVTSAAGDADYATDGTLQYYRTDDGWKKLTDEQIEKQDAVTAALGITPEEYWGDRREEYNFAYEKPGKYLVTKAIGGYDAYKAYNDKLNDIKADKDKEGKSISGSRKEKVIKYINSLNIPYGEKLILFKSEYPADDTYNQKIVDYLYSLEELTEKEVETILKELDFKVGTNGKVTW